MDLYGSNGIAQQNSFSQSVRDINQSIRNANNAVADSLAQLMQEQSAEEMEKHAVQGYKIAQAANSIKAGMRQYGLASDAERHAQLRTQYSLEHHPDFDADILGGEGEFERRLGAAGGRPASIGYDETLRRAQLQLEDSPQTKAPEPEPEPEPDFEPEPEPEPDFEPEPEPEPALADEPIPEEVEDFGEFNRPSGVAAERAFGGVSKERIAELSQHLRGDEEIIGEGERFGMRVGRKLARAFGVETGWETGKRMDTPFVTLEQLEQRAGDAEYAAAMGNRGAPWGLGTTVEERLSDLSGASEGSHTSRAVSVASTGEEAEEAAARTFATGTSAVGDAGRAAMESVGRGIEKVGRFSIPRITETGVGVYARGVGGALSGGIDVVKDLEKIRDEGFVKAVTDNPLENIGNVMNIAGSGLEVAGLAGIWNPLGAATEIVGAATALTGSALELIGEEVYGDDSAEKAAQDKIRGQAQGEVVAPRQTPIAGRGN
tara:strand:- start:3050 stop:4516 length:1467 start_codon:yes stop_codon:yes gene_type:complete